MARKKSSQRKVKMGGELKENSGNENSKKTPPLGEDKESEGQNDGNNNEEYSKGQSTGGKPPASLPLDKQGKPFIPVKVKQEPKLNFDSHFCSQSNPHGFGQKEPTIKFPKVKQEQEAVKTPTSAMDLGSHLHQSLAAHGNPGLTWSHLMEPKNFPKPYEHGHVTLKKESSSHLMAVSSKTEKESSNAKQGKDAKDEQLGSSKDRVTISTVASISSVPNKFASSSGNRKQLSEGAAAAGGTDKLDLSKKGLPSEIRRMLASKYGLPKRNDEGSSVVPNFAKSRSRFTVAPRKAPSSSESQSSKEMDPNVSPPQQDSDIDTTCSGTKQKNTPASTALTNPSGLTVTQVEHQSTKSDSDQLKNHGMLDLASHYGNLIKETTPAIQPRSASRSPQTDETTASPGPPNLGEGMIDLGTVSRMNELRVPTLRIGGEPMINLSAMETPTSPLSPSFRPVSFGMFPNPTYRSNSNTTQSYRPRLVSAGRPPRCNPSPGLVPRLPFGSHRPLSPDPRPAAGSMIDLGSFGKGNEFSGMVTSRPSDIVSLSSQVARRIMPKRRHSLDSHSLREVAKRPCIERKKDESHVKVENNVKLNIGDLLKLEQEEQKYIKDLSFVQNKLTDMRFKIQMMQQELETLQSSEGQIKQHIDMVRTKRVKILKDAQDREGSTGSSGSLASNVPEKNADRIQPAVERETSTRVERIVTYDRASPGYQASFHDDQPEDLRRGSETKQKVEVVTDLEAEEKELMRGSDRIRNRRVEIDRFGGYHYSNFAPRLQQSGSHNEMTTYTTEIKSEKSQRFGNDDDESQHDKVIFSEDIEMQSGAIENSDGTLLLRQPSLSHRVKKGTNCLMDKVKGTERNGPKQFLGCLEISSTTPEVLDDQILTENERKPVVKNVSSDQEMISSTVSSLDENVDETQNLSEIEFIGHTDAVCAIIPFRKKLFSASADRTVRAFDFKTGECTNIYQGHQKGINCLQIASDVGNRDRLFTGSNDQTVRAYNMKSGTCTHKFSFRGRVMCLHIAFGKLFVGLSSGFVAVIDLKSNQCIDQFNCHEPSRISCIVSATSGQRTFLCTGSFDSTITIRDQGSGRLLRTIKDHKLTVLCMQVVGDILFSGSADTVVQSHNTNTGELVQTYIGHSMSVSGLQAMGGAQGGGVLVTSSLDRIIRCFDITSGDLLQLYGGNNDMIFSLAVCRDMIYSGCRDGKLSGVKLDLRKYHCCKWGTCSLKFGLLGHLKQHVQDHANQTYVFDTCLWENCTHKFHRGKQIDVMQAAMEHIISHVPDTET